MSVFEIEVGPVQAVLRSGNPRVIDKVLCIRDPSAGSDMSCALRLWDGLIHFFDKDSGTFPAGLANRLTLRLAKRGHQTKITYNPPIPTVSEVPADFLIGRDMSGTRAFQRDAVNTGLRVGRGIWWVATNGGKSSMIAAFTGRLARSGFRSVIIVPNKYLVNQTSTEVQELLGPDVRVGIAGDGKRNLSGPILVATYQTLLRGVPADSTGLAEDAELFSALQRADAVLVDEGHHATSAGITRILKTCDRAVWRIACTGTVDKRDKREGRSDEKASLDAYNAKATEHRWRLESYIGPVIARVTNAQLIEAGISAKPIVLLVEDRDAFGPRVATPTPVPGKPFMPQLVYQEVFRAAAIKDKRFRASVARAARAFLNAKLPPFVFSHSVAQLTRLKKTFDALNVPCEILTGKESTSVRQGVVNRFKSEQNFAILASSIFDEGASINEIRGCILAGARRSAVELLQRLGRGLRKKGSDNVVHIVDFSMMHSTLLFKHYKSRLATYEDQGLDTVRVADFTGLSALLSCRDQTSDV